MFLSHELACHGESLFLTLPVSRIGRI
jgi:hypothetical protein